MISINIAESKKCNGEYSLFMTFPYDSKLVQSIRTFSNRHWDYKNKVWELGLGFFETVLTWDTHEIEITGNINALQTINNKADFNETELPENFHFKTTPYQHQIDGVKFGLSHNNWFLGDEQGLGKTKQVIDIAVARKVAEGFKHCLIICGVNGLKWNWANEIKIHSDESGWILGQRTNKHGQLTIGTNKAKLDDVRSLDKIKSYFIITNVETMRDETIVTELQNQCKAGNINMIAIDECHKCFDYDTKILTQTGYAKIGDLVKNRTVVNVASFNQVTAEFEWKPITNWFENIIAEPMIELTIETSDHKLRTIKCTGSHKIRTNNRGWVCAKDLTEEDDIAEFINL